MPLTVWCSFSGGGILRQTPHVLDLWRLWSGARRMVAFASARGPARRYSSLPFNNCLFLFGFSACTLELCDKDIAAGQKAVKRSLRLKIKICCCCICLSEIVSLAPSRFFLFLFPMSEGSQTTQTWDFCKATEKVFESSNT